MRGRTGLYVLAVLIGINFLNYLDRYLPAAAASAIQDEFHLSDGELGLLGTAFLLVYAVASVPLGLWADRSARRAVIGTGVAIWSVATLFTGFARSFPQLLLTRGVLGIGEASYFPAGTSLLSDLFDKNARGRTMAFRDAGSVFGIAVGYVGGGIIAERFGWRQAFFYTALPGLLFAVLAFTMPEPPRGQAEARGPLIDRPKDASLATFKNLWEIPTVRALVLSQVLLFWVLGSLSAFLPLYMHRRFGLGLAAAATAGGGVLIAGGLIGTFAGGWLGDWRARRVAHGHLQVGVAGFLAAAVLIALTMLTNSLAGTLPLAFGAAIALYLYSAPFTAQLQNVVAPSLRASAVTLSLFVTHLFGDAWSPAALGALSDLLHSLSLAILLTCPLALLAAAALAYAGFKTVARDTASMEESWAQRPPLEPAPEPA